MIKNIVQLRKIQSSGGSGGTGGGSLFIFVILYCIL